MQRKKKKTPAPWRANILDHHKKNKTRSERGDFPEQVVKQLKEESGGLCQVCFVSRGTQTHHVMPRGRSGRGVKTNGARVCNHCHNKMHNDNALLEKLIEEHRIKYGEYFWYDEIDKMNLIGRN